MLDSFLGYAGKGTEGREGTRQCTYSPHKEDLIMVECHSASVRIHLCRICLSGSLEANLVTVLSPAATCSKHCLRSHDTHARPSSLKPVVFSLLIVLSLVLPFRASFQALFRIRLLMWDCSLSCDKIQKSDRPNPVASAHQRHVQPGSLSRLGRNLEVEELSWVLFSQWKSLLSSISFGICL